MANENTAVAPTKKQHPVAVFMGKLDAREQDLAGALEGTGVTPRAFLRAAKTSIRLNLDLAATSFDSFWNACLRACRDGLLPDGVEGSIVPYKTQAQWLPMYQGMLRQFRRSGKFKWIGADVVREGDVFQNFVDEQGQHFKHEPKGDGSAPIIKVYAAATTLDGGFFLAVLSMKDIDKIRAMSRAQRDDSPWKRWQEEMMKKSALRRLSKVLPSARDVMAADEDDEEIEELRSMTIEHDEPAAQRPRLVGSAALDEFAGGGGEEGMESASEVNADEEAGADADVSRAAAPASESSQGPKTPEAYFAYAEVTINRMREQGSETRELVRWFQSDDQRKIRGAIGIEVDAVNAFTKRVLP